VTIFQGDVYWGLGPFSIRTGRTFIKTDIDWCHLEELIWFTREARRTGVAVMTLFMHSYSLIKLINRGRYFNRMRPDPVDREKLEGFLAYCRSQADIEFLTVRQYRERFLREPLVGTDAVPSRRHDVSVLDKIRFYW
jgi:hypothetical protein